MFPIRRLRLAQGPSLALLGLLGSCQSTVTVVEESGPTATSPATSSPICTFRLADSDLLPDSARFRTRLDSGTASFTRSASGSATEFHFQTSLSKPLGSDSLGIAMYTFGLRTMRLSFRSGDNADGTVLVGVVPDAADSAADRLLRAFQLVRKLEPSSHSRADSPRDSQLADFRQTIAQLALTGNDAAKGISAKPPEGLDTADLNARVLRLALKAGVSLGESARKWTLAMTASQAQDLASKLSLDLAPLSPFKWTAPLAMDTLRPSETNQSLRGKLSGKFGVKALSVQIVGTDDKPASGFETSGIPDLSTSPADFAFTGQVGVTTRPEAKAGSYTLIVSATDTFGNRGSWRLAASLGDAPDKEGPSVEFMDPTPAPSGRRLLSFADSALVVKVRVLDRSGVKSVRIGGKVADPLGGDLWSATVRPTLGDDSVVVEAIDIPGAARNAALPIHRCQKMSITLLVPSTSDTSVSSTTTSIPVAWSVKGATTVKIGNGISTSTTDRHEASAMLVEGTNRIYLAAVDSAGRPDTNVLSVKRRFLAPLTISYPVDTATTLPDSLVVLPQGDPGSTFWWSVGSLAWTEFTGRLTVRTSGALRIRVAAPGKDTAIATLPERQFYHRNHAPTASLAKTSLVVMSYQGSFTVPGVGKVLDWGLGDGVQTGTWEFQFQDPTWEQFLAKVGADAQGGLSGLVLQDTMLTFRFRMRLVDDGGTANGGENQSAWTDWAELRIVDTVQDADGNSYRARRMPDQKVWMRSNLRTLPETQFDPDTSCPTNGCFASGRLYSKIQAFTYSAAMNIAMYAAPSRGMCPWGWHVAAKSEWTTLFKATLPTGQVDSLFALRRDSTWHWSGKQTPGGYRAGGGTFGDFVLPNGYYAMSGDEMWIWIPKESKPVEIGEGVLGLHFQLGGGDGSGSTRAGIRCVMD